MQRFEMERNRGCHSLRAAGEARDMCDESAGVLPGYRVHLRSAACLPASAL